MILRESEIRQKWRHPLKNECSLSWSFLYQKSGTEDTDNAGGIMDFP